MGIIEFDIFDVYSEYNSTSGHYTRVGNCTTSNGTLPEGISINHKITLYFNCPKSTVIIRNSLIQEVLHQLIFNLERPLSNALGIPLPISCYLRYKYSDKKSLSPYFLNIK